MTDLSPETVERIKWSENAAIAFSVSMAFAIGWWIVIGEPIGGRLWLTCLVTGFASCAWYDWRAYRRSTLATSTTASDGRG